jgi:cyclic 2,3-diphosphoglycerate synthetase
LTRAIVLIDGEHYEAVVRDAVGGLPYEVVAAVLVGGSEKLRGGEDYGVPVAAGLEEAIDAHEPDVVVDLSDEPVLGPRERFLLASRALAAGIPYEGADFRFEAPVYHPVPLPSVAVIGTGKRVGKTALTGRLAQVLSRDRSVVVVAMGRGGPRDPEVVEAPPTVEALVELSRSGRHAASDHLETAALVGVPTVGARRCGGGLAGAPYASNVLEAVDAAARLEPQVLVLDGSGAAIPPVAAQARVLVTRGREEVTDGLNPYRVLVSDLVVLTGGDEALRDEVQAIADVPVVRACLRLRAAEPLGDGRVAVFTAGATETGHLEADVVAVSTNLARREALRDDLERIAADTYLVEVKAAAIDVVAEAALARRARLVFAANDVEPLPGEPDLDGLLVELADRAAAAVHV